ncbi:hypothetical protein A2U01_0111283, partial [Trifolium medium]|nr:hypothetical protein [Trifolium medium]
CFENSHNSSCGKVDGIAKNCIDCIPIKPTILPLTMVVKLNSSSSNGKALA